jgi:uncharacterized protein (DUF983 family)
MSEGHSSWIEKGAPRAPLLKVSLRCLCPRCGEGRLFEGFLKLRSACERCKLDFSPIDTGDGPQVFVILIGGALVASGALIVEALFQPPYWLHLALWLPAVLSVTLGLLRPVKSTLIALQYMHKARESRREEQA